MKQITACEDGSLIVDGVRYLPGEAVPCDPEPAKPLRERVTLGSRLRRPDGTVTEPIVEEDQP